MKTKPLLIVAALLICSFGHIQHITAQVTSKKAACGNNCGQQCKPKHKAAKTQLSKSMNSSKIGTKPIACKLTSKELQERKATVIAALKSAVLERTELDNGYSYKFSGDDETIDRLTTFIKTERSCCGFFTFTLTITDENAILSLTGPDGAKGFVDTEIGL